MGVTGGGAADSTIADTMRRCRALTTLPRCLGFGIGKSSDLSPWRGLAEGVIVGSALLDELMGASDAKARESLARAFTRAFRAKLPDLAPA